jgi:hypothetical protein
MVRTVVYFFLFSIVLGTVLTPGLAFLAILLVPVFGFVLVWRALLTLVTHGHPSEAVVHTKRCHLLGPGGPDDPFASDRLDEDEYLTQESPTARAA